MPSMTLPELLKVLYFMAPQLIVAAQWIDQAIFCH